MKHTPPAPTGQHIHTAWDAGFTDLIPLIPVGGPLYQGGVMADGTHIPACDVPENQMGKVPGTFRHGAWNTAWEWNTWQLNETEVAYYAEAGANVGLKTGIQWVGLDVDVTDPDTARAMAEALVAAGVDAPVRWGQAPKFMVLFRIAEGEIIRRQKFPLVQDGADRTQIEVMGLTSTGNPSQVVMLGSHPSGSQYQWDNKWSQMIFALGGAAHVPTITADRMAELVEILKGLAVTHGWRVGAGSTSDGDGQASDLGTTPHDPALVARVMDLMPNTEEVLWDDWVKIGIACKAALGDEGFPIWEAWSRKSKLYNVGDNTAKRWKSFKPSGAMGFGTLVHKLREMLGGLPTDLEIAVRGGVQASEFDRWCGLMPADAGPLPTGALLADVEPLPVGAFVHDSKGHLVQNQQNVFTVLVQDERWRDVLAFNAFTQRVTIDRPLPTTSIGKRDLQDVDYATTQGWFQLNYFPKIGIEDVRRAVHRAAQQRVVEPVQDYLNSLPACPDPSILDRWLFDLFGVVRSDDPMDMMKMAYISAIGRKWAIAAVARAMHPGCKTDNILILEGKQGIGKSTGLAALMPDRNWFGDNLPNFQKNPKDASQYLNGKWMIELSEMATILATKNEDARGFLSRQEEEFRGAYQINFGHVPRRCVFAGTTNRTDYVKDAAGERRFWMVVCEKVNVPLIVKWRDALWRAALDALNGGEDWYSLPRGIAQQALKEQKERSEDDPWLSEVKHRLGEMTETCAEQVLDLMDLSLAERDHKTKGRVGKCLRQLGFEPDKLVSSGKYRGRSRWVKT